MIRILLTTVAALVASSPQDPSADLHAGLERAKVAIETLLQPDGDANACLKVFSADARRALGDDRITSMLGMFRRDLPEGRVRLARVLESGNGELIVYSAKADVGAVFTLSLEEQPPHGIGIVSVELVDGDPVVDGIVDGMSAEAMAALLDGWIPGLVEGDRFSGTVLLAKDGEVVFERAYGLASRRFDVPNRVDTKFNLGSMNKMFTAVAIAQLVDAGAFAYDELVSDLLPDYPRKDLLAGITVQHLLTHTSGLGSFWEAMFETDWTRLREPRDHIPLFADVPPMFEPGARFSYSNTGFLLLGLVIESVSGRSYYDYVRKEIFEPAGMANTDSWAMDEPVPNLAIGYTHSGTDGHGHGAPLRNNLYLHRARGGPAGGGFSTVHDLLRFSEALFAGTLLPREAVDELVTGKVSTGWGESAGYGYGFADQRANGNRFVGHNGGAPGINAQLSIFPEDGWTVVALSNLDSGASRVAGRMLEMVGRADG